MFAIFKRWFGKRQDSKKATHYPALTLRQGASRAIQAEVPVFRGPKSISEEVISRVAKEIELEGLGPIKTSQATSRIFPGEDMKHKALIQPGIIFSGLQSKLTS